MIKRLRTPKTRAIKKKYKSLGPVKRPVKLLLRRERG
jgi:hypothetical protein